jgi:PIN domain protein
MHSPDPKSLRDSMIAAESIRHGYRLVTRNTRDFERAGVKLFNLWEPEPIP